MQTNAQAAFSILAAGCLAGCLIPSIRATAGTPVSIPARSGIITDAPAADYTIDHLGGRLASNKTLQVHYGPNANDTEDTELTTEDTEERIDFKNLRAFVSSCEKNGGMILTAEVAENTEEKETF